MLNSRVVFTYCDIDKRREEQIILAIKFMNKTKGLIDLFDNHLLLVYMFDKLN